MSTTTKLEVNLSKKYIPPVDPVEPEEGSKEWCKDHLEDPRCEQYRPVNPDDPTPTPTPTPEPQQDVPNTGYFTSQTDDNHTTVNQSQISAIFFGGFCLLLILAFVLPKQKQTKSVRFVK